VHLNRSCPTHDPGAANGPIEGFVRASLGFCCSIRSLDTDVCPYFDNHNFDIFDAGGPQCHFITSVPHAGGFRRWSSMPLTPLCKTCSWFSDFYPFSTGT